MNRKQKEKVVEELSQIFSDSGVVIVAHYSGLTVSEISELRNLMRDANCGVRVAKNRLSKINIIEIAIFERTVVIEGERFDLSSKNPDPIDDVEKLFKK